MEIIISILNGFIKGGWVGMTVGIIIYSIKLKRIPSALIERLIIVEGIISIFLIVIT